MDEIYHKLILATLNQPNLIIKELVLKGTEMVGGGGGVVKLTKMQCCRQTMVKMQIDVVCLFALQSHYKL